MRRLALVLLAFTLCLPQLALPQSASRVAAAKPARAVSAELRALVSALRSIDARTSSGISLADYSREVGDLTVAARAYEDSLGRRDDAARVLVADVIAPYQDAKELWAACLNDDECSYGIIASGMNTPITRFTQSLLDRYPSLKRPTAAGGALMDGSDDRAWRIHYSRALSALWAVGQERSKALRAKLQPG